MKNQLLIISVFAALIGGCDSSDQVSTGEESSMQKATQHAKQAAKELGKAVTETAESTDKKWTEMNKDRHEVSSSMEEDEPTQEADMKKIKEKYESVKTAAVKKTGELVDKAKKMAE